LRLQECPDVASKQPPLTYRDAGVDIDAGNELVRRIQRLVRRTEDPRVLHGVGGFAGLFSLDYNGHLLRKNYRKPVLVACTDGVGTKLKVAVQMGRHDTVGIDLVAMSANDLACTGAEPLFFLDYLVCGKLDPSVAEAVVRGIARACRDIGCALLGGETAEHPGELPPGEYDLAGFAVGVVERSRIIDGSRIREGDEVLGLASSGLHSNGYSLARKLLAPEARALRRRVDVLGRTLGEELLEPTLLYPPAVRAILKPYRKKRVLHGLAHITGGGLLENAPRIFGSSTRGLRLRLDPARWEILPIFHLLQEHGVEAQEM
jgi:phosphoribosylformylglycinamidine cyclo-ligase